MGLQCLAAKKYPHYGVASINAVVPSAASVKAAEEIWRPGEFPIYAVVVQMH